MITTRNKRAYGVAIKTITDRAAHLVQALEKCPLEFTVEALARFDKYNSPGTRHRSARRWIRQFAGFESDAAQKGMEPIIEILNDGRPVTERGVLIELMKDMRDTA